MPSLSALPVGCRSAVRRPLPAGSAPAGSASALSGCLSAPSDSMAEPSDSAPAPVDPSAPDAATSASTIMATASSAGTCSQILSTVHPSAWHMDVVSRSRRAFRLSFASQYSRLVRGDARVLRAGVPEAPVDEHGDLEAREHDVRAPPLVGPRREIHAVPVAPGVQESADRQLGSRVAARVGAHRARRRLAGRPRAPAVPAAHPSSDGFRASASASRPAAR